MSMRSVLTADDDIIGTNNAAADSSMASGSRGHIIARLANYKGGIVTVEWLGSDPVSLGRTELVELKTVRGQV